MVWGLLGWHADEGTGGGWSPKCSVGGVVEVGDLGSVSVLFAGVLMWMQGIYEE